MQNLGAEYTDRNWACTSNRVWDSETNETLNTANVARRYVPDTSGSFGREGKVRGKREIERPGIFISP